MHRLRLIKIKNQPHATLDVAQPRIAEILHRTPAGAFITVVGVFHFVRILRLVSLLGRAGVRSVLVLDCSLEGVASGPAESRRSKISAEMIPAAISSTASTRSRLIQRRRRCGAAGVRCGALGPAGLATGRLGLVR